MNDVAVATNADLPEITAKASLFVQLLLAGKPTVVAHKLAGYKGDPHAAYALRAKLKPHLSRGVEDMGVDKESLACDINALDQLPVNATELTVKEKLQLMSQKQKFIEACNPSAPPVMSRFIIKKSDVVDVQPVGEQNG